MIADWIVRIDRAVAPVGSTRGAALLRILLVFVVWSRWADDLLFLRNLAPDRLVLSVVFYTTTTWLLIGYHTRAAAIAVAAVVWTMVFGYGDLWDSVEGWRHHHTTVIAYACAGLALTPCGTSLSADRWLALRRAERDGTPPPAERGNLLGLTLLGVFVSTVYFWSAFDKSSWPFFSGQRLEFMFVEFYSGSDWAPPPQLRPLFAAAGATVVILEYTLAFGLWVPRLRPWLLGAGLLLHGLFYVSISVSTFTVTMWALYLVFLDQDALHRAIDRMFGAR